MGMLVRLQRGLSRGAPCSGEAVSGRGWVVLLACLGGLLLGSGEAGRAGDGGYQVTIAAKVDPGNAESYCPARFDFVAEVKDAAGKPVAPSALDIRWEFGDFFPGTTTSKGYDYDTLKPVYLYADPGEVTVKLLVRDPADHSRTGEATKALSIKAPQTDVRKFYAAPNGDDSNPGTLDKPWKNLFLAMAKLKPGDTLFLRKGIYDLTAMRSKGKDGKTRNALDFAVHGTPETPITVRGYPGEEAVITPKHTSAAFFIRHNFVRVCDLVIDKPCNGILPFSKGLVFDGLTICHAVGKGKQNTSAFYPHHMTESVIRNCLCYDIWMNGKGAPNSTGAMFYYSNYNLIENNEVHSTGAGFFDKDSGNGNIFRYNYIHDVKQWGIHRMTQGNHPALRDRFYGNVIVRAGTGLGFWGNIGELRWDLFFNNTIAFCDTAFKRLHREGYHWHDQRIWNNVCVHLKHSVRSESAYTYFDYNAVDDEGGMASRKPTGKPGKKKGSAKQSVALDPPIGKDNGKHRVRLEALRFLKEKPTQPEDYRLPEDSPLRAKAHRGRFGVEMRGAYFSDDVIVGRMPPASKGNGRIPGGAPSR